MLVGALLLIAPQESQAVPAWSRLTGSTCNSCHATPTWQLTPFGLSFLRNGHRLEAAPAKFDLDSQKWDNYLSLVWKFRAYDEEDKNPSSQLEQHSFSLYAGGALSERFSFFTEMYFSENTGKTAEGGSFTTATDGVVQEDGSRKKLAEAFLQYNQPIGKGFLAVRAGEILPEIIHVFGAGARSAEQRALVLNDKANSANPYKPFNRQQGFDVKLNMEPLEIAAGVVNGSDYTNSIDSNNHKDWFASALLAFDKNESAIGLYHYDGKYTLYGTVGDPTSGISLVNDFTRDGFLFRFIRSNWRVVGAYFMGEETTTAAGVTTDNEGYYGLVDFNLSDKFGVYVRYDMLDPNSDLGGNETTQYMFGLNGMFYMTAKSGARWNLELTNKEVQSLTAADTRVNRALLQITWAF
jgi:hypothetical protein